jgi:hypothetical protein
MNNAAQTRTNSNAVSMPYALSMMLAVNTFALVALDHLGQIPAWIKSAVALFLAF